MNIQNTDAYQHLSYRIEVLEELLRRVQGALISDIETEQSLEDSKLLDALIAKHEALQFERGKMVNENFGSVFRVMSHPSQFAFSTQRYVDIYTSRLENLLHYPENYTFYPQHQRLPHEPKPQYQSIAQLFEENGIV